MGEFFKVMIPLFGLGLFPVWMPLVGAGCGALMDRIRPATITPAEAAVNAIKERSALLRTNAQIAAVQIEASDEVAEQLVA